MKWLFSMTTLMGVGLLAILSFLPAGTTKENLHWWAPTSKPSMIPSAVANLSKAALLLKNKRQDSGSPVFFVVPVVQSFMQQQGRMPDEIRKQIQSCCRYVLDHACRFDEPAFLVESKTLAAEDSNIQSILFNSSTTHDSHSSDRTIEALIAFYWYCCDTKPNPYLAKYAVATAEASGIEKHISLAEWCLGRTYFFLTLNSIAFEHLYKAFQLFSAPGDLQWQRLGDSCGIDLVDCARLTPEDDMSYEDVVHLAHDIEVKCATLSDNLIHGRSISFLGFALYMAGQTKEALPYLDRAKTMLEAVGNALHIAEVYQIIGRLHLHQREIPEALDALAEAWKQAEMSCIPHIQADVSLDFGRVLFGVDKDIDAMRFIEISLMKYSYLGSQLGITYALDFVSYGYLRRGDYEDAYSAYDAAAETFVRVNEELESQRCKENRNHAEAKES